MAKDVLPEAQESRDFRSKVDRLVEKARDTATPQIDKFKDLARDLGADDDEARFEEAVRKIAPTGKRSDVKDSHDR